MANTRRFPKAIAKRIESYYTRDISASEAAEKINESAQAKRLGVTTNTRQVAAAYANLTMGNRLYD